MVFFKSEDTRCCDFIILVAAVILLGRHLRRNTGTRTDGNPQLCGSCQKGVALRLYGHGPLTSCHVKCFVSDTCCVPFITTICLFAMHGVLLLSRLQLPHIAEAVVACQLASVAVIYNYHSRARREIQQHRNIQW
jgi:hypothetical protein